MKFYDSQNHYLGSTDKRGNREVAHDKQNHYKGEYDSEKNTTYDSQGRKVGEGNLLPSLIRDED